MAWLLFTGTKISCAEADASALIEQTAPVLSTLVELREKLTQFSELS
jgi:hypothetical protein